MSNAHIRLKNKGAEREFSGNAGHINNGGRESEFQLTFAALLSRMVLFWMSTSPR